MLVRRQRPTRSNAGPLSSARVHPRWRVAIASAPVRVVGAGERGGRPNGGKSASARMIATYRLLPADYRAMSTLDERGGVEMGKYRAVFACFFAVALASCVTTSEPQSGAAAQADDAAIPPNYRELIIQMISARTNFTIRSARISRPTELWVGLVAGGNRRAICVEVFRDSPLGGSLQGIIGCSRSKMGEFGPRGTRTKSMRAIRRSTNW